MCELINVIGIKLYSVLLFVLPTALTGNASRSIQELLKLQNLKTFASISNAFSIKL